MSKKLAPAGVVDSFSSKASGHAEPVPDMGVEALEARALFTAAPLLMPAVVEPAVIAAAQQVPAPAAASTSAVTRGHSVAAAAAPTRWPVAPFDSAEVAAKAHTKAARNNPAISRTIYPNQFGFALLTNQTLSAGSLDRYTLAFDDGGTLSVKATPTGPSAAAGFRTDVAYYDHFANGDEDASGSATHIDTRARATGAVVGADVSADKQTQYLVVRPHAAGTGGTYTLRMQGPAEGELYPLNISAKTNYRKGFVTGISGTNDVDYWQFTVPRGGNWVVDVTPTPNDLHPHKALLDPTLNVYDAKGNPLGGTFDSTIDRGGPGVPESWTGVGLKGGSTYVAAVNGVGSSLGHYVMRVRLAAVPDVSVTATAPTQATPGQFTVSRSVAGNRPLTVQYAVTGTAVAGQDFAAFDGEMVIPAGQTSASIEVDALGSETTGGGKSVIFSLIADPAYNVAGGSSSDAMLTILQTPAPASGGAR